MKKGDIVCYKDRDKHRQTFKMGLIVKTIQCSLGGAASIVWNNGRQTTVYSCFLKKIEIE